ncbi:MAG: universal stress protein [Cytophagales bacterium]|nr:universal stress protein [Cytophagales bacterium]
MKKILCPVDFSNASKNGMEYAGNLAAALMAHLTLAYIKPTIWPEAIQLKEEVALGIAEIRASLQVLADACEKEFGVTCGVRVEEASSTLEKAIAREGEEHDLIVMGTNGADDYYQYIFGSNSFQVMKRSGRAVLVIPEGCTFRPVSQIVYAFDPGTNPHFLVDQLRALAVPLQASVRVLHVLDAEPSAENDKKLDLLKKGVMDRADKMIDWSFEGKYGIDISWALDRYVTSQSSEILALSFHHRTLVDKLFRENVIKKLSMTAHFPVFTFWS